MSRRRKKRLVVVPTFPPFEPAAPRRPTLQEDVTARLFAQTVEAAAGFYESKPRVFRIFNNFGLTWGWRPRCWHDGGGFTLAWRGFRIHYQKDPRGFWFLWGSQKFIGQII